MFLSFWVAPWVTPSLRCTGCNAYFCLTQEGPKRKAPKKFKHEPVEATVQRWLGQLPREDGRDGRAFARVASFVREFACLTL